MSRQSLNNINIIDEESMMPAITTQELRIHNSDLFNRMIDENATYVGLSRTSPWIDDNAPPDIYDSIEDRVLAYQELVGMKRVLSTNIRSVLPRIDWVYNEIYDQYESDVDMINQRTTSGQFIKFYVITDEFNVYKCLSNANGSKSTIKPSGTAVNPITTSDGYIWKYMYTVRSTDATGFMTTAWIPCYTLYTNDGSAQWIVQQSAVPGSIEVCVVNDPGINYTEEPTVTIIGDGTNATARATFDPVTGLVTSVYIVNPGSNYTYANVVISDGGGVGALASAVISPLSGHGSDARVELGATYKMIRLTFDSDEGGKFSVDTSYRQAMIVMNPLSTTTGTLLIVNDSHLYVKGETITGSTSGAYGVVAAVDTTRNWIYVTSVVGAFLINESVSSQDYNSQVVNGLQLSRNVPLSASVVASSEVVANSGSVIYMSKREPITRHPDQVEEGRFVIAF